jgi:hypothetical protein
MTFVGYSKLQDQKKLLSELPEQIAELESQISALRSAYPSPNKSTPSHLTLPLSATLLLSDSKREELAQIEAQITSLSGEDIPRIQQELARTEAEIQTLNARKKAAVGRAQEAQARKERGGVDEVERRGRWVKAGEKVLRDVLEVDG